VAVRERMAARAATMGASPAGGEVEVRQPADGVQALQQEVDGERMLGYLRVLLGRYVAWPSDAALDAAVLWIAHAAARDGEGKLIWRASPRLLLTSSQNGSGKSTVLDLVALVLHSRFGRIKPTFRALVQILGRYNEVALLDEAQVTFGAGRKSEDIRQAINAGYTPRAAALSMHGSKADAVPMFGPVAMAGLDSLITDTSGRLADTLARCVIVRLSRAPRRMPELDEDGEQAAQLIGTALSAWTAQQGFALRLAARRLAARAADEDPATDIGDGGRYAQICRPLRAVAEVAGGRWPEASEVAVGELARAAAGAGQGDSALADLDAIMSGWDITQEEL
jgi:hypothetical protein